MKRFFLGLCLMVISIVGFSGDFKGVPGDCVDVVYGSGSGGSVGIENAPVFCADVVYGNGGGGNVGMK